MNCIHISPHIMHTLPNSGEQMIMVTDKKPTLLLSVSAELFSISSSNSLQCINFFSFFIFLLHGPLHFWATPVLLKLLSLHIYGCQTA